MGTKVTTELDIELAKWKLKTEEVKRDMASMRNAARSGPSISEGLFGSLKNHLPEIGAIGAAVGIKEMLSHFDELNDAATKLGETPEALQRAGRAAELSGTSVDGLANAFIKLEKNLGDIENAKAAEVLESYGLSAQKLIAMPIDQKLVALADAFKKARDEGKGVFELQELLGKSSAELIPLLEEGGDSIRAMYEGTSVVGNEAVAQMASLNDEVDNVIGNLMQLGGRALIFVHDGIAKIGAMIDYSFGVVRKYASKDGIVAKFLDNVPGVGKLGDLDALEKLQKEFDKRKQDAEDKANRTSERRKDRAKNLQAQIDAKKAADEAKKDDEALKKEDERWKRIDALVKQLREANIDLLPPPEKLEALKKDLKDVLKAAAEESDIEKQLGLKLEATKLKKDIEATQQQIDRDNKPTVTKTAQLPGEVTSAFNLLFGRSANELILDETRQQTAEQRTTNRLLTQIKEQLKDGNGISVLNEVFAP